MKIAVTARGAGLGAWLDPDFERSLQVVVVDDDNQFEAWMNSETNSEQFDGLALAAKLVTEQVDILITGKINAESLAYLLQAGISVKRAEQGCVLELIEAARNQTLESLT